MNTITICTTTEFKGRPTKVYKNIRLLHNYGEYSLCSVVVDGKEAYKECFWNNMLGDIRA